jgi:hypothetical protein
MQRIVNDLCEALSSELEAFREEPVFLDEDRLQGGYLYNEALAEALCNSACMILVFTPTYFSRDHTYCAREYRAMEKLETERLDLLSDSAGGNRGLIIPIVFRGEDHLPAEIREQRKYYDFSDFLLCDDEIWRHPRYAVKIREIAEYICARCEELENVGPAFSECEDFALPSEEDARNWLHQATDTSIPFPGREEGR